ncbi:MAG: hypothetical protein U0893_16350 [Chloroflexota bacterium]
MAVVSHPKPIQRVWSCIAVLSAIGLLATACGTEPPEAAPPAGASPPPAAATRTGPRMDPNLLPPQPTPTVFFNFNGEPAHFRRPGYEYSAATGGQVFGPKRGTGYEVRLIRLEGRRWLVHDPQTNGPAYVDRADLTVSPEVQAKVVLSSQPAQKSVVVVVAPPAGYPDASAALHGLAAWLRQSVRSGDRYTFVWGAPAGAGSTGEIVPQLVIPIEPQPPHLSTPTPLPITCTYDDACLREAEREERRRKDALADFERRREAHQQLVHDLVASTAGVLDAASASAPTGPTDLPNAIGRAARLLANAPGERWLLVAAPLNPPDHLPDVTSLEGVQIGFTFPYVAPSDTGHFDDYVAVWVRWAANLQADLRVLDPSADLPSELI